MDRRSARAPTACSPCALIHELLRADRIDLEYLVRYTNAHWLVIDAPGTAEDGLFARDAEGHAAVLERAMRGIARADARGHLAAVVGEVHARRRPRAVPAFELPGAHAISIRNTRRDTVADRCGVRAETIRRLARELARSRLRRGDQAADRRGPMHGAANTPR